MKNRSASRDAHFNPRVLFGFLLSSIGALLALMAVSIYTSSPAVAAGTSQGLKPIVIYPTYHDTSIALRDQPAWPEERQQEHEAALNPYIHTQHTDAEDNSVQHGWLGRLAPSIPQPLLNFAGIPFPGVGCSCAPPDTDGEVGQTQYVQMVNEGVQVWDKATGTSLLGPISIGSIWVGMGGVCQTAGEGDPVVLYDQLANRWVISQFANNLHDECIAVSTTNDATGTWNRYDFPLGTTTLHDYPKLSVWPDAYYMSMNIFNSSGTAYLGPQPFAFDRSKMLTGATATMVTFPSLGASFPPIMPADLDGSTLPPSGAPNSFLLWPNTNTFRIYHFHVDFVNTANSTFALFGSSPSNSFTAICPGNRNCVPALGALPQSGQGMDAIGDRLMFRLGYRNFGDHESLTGNFTVSSGGVAGIRWFELRGVTAGPITTFQQSTYQPDTDWRWMGSVAMDGAGNMAMGFSASSPTIHTQIRYTGRMASDPINTMGLGEAHIKDGNGAQINTSNRWGDYSDMTVDPVDDMTFWYTQEYYDTVSSFNWRTEIASFKLASATDTVTISKAQYTTSSSQLTVGATDSNPAAVLTVTVTSSGQSLGTMKTHGDGSYQLKKSGIANPVNITVTSNLGGSASSAVRVR